MAHGRSICPALALWQGRGAALLLLSAPLLTPGYTRLLVLIAATARGLGKGLQM